MSTGKTLVICLTVGLIKWCCYIKWVTFIPVAKAKEKLNEICLIIKQNLIWKETQKPTHQNFNLILRLI